LFNASVLSTFFIHNLDSLCAGLGGLLAGK
jgi:hypothetical protein